MLQQLRGASANPQWSHGPADPPADDGLEHSIQLVVWQAKPTIFTIVINLTVTECVCKRFKVPKASSLVHVISHNNALTHNRQSLKYQLLISRGNREEPN